MNPQSDPSGLGVPTPGSDLGQLPPIHPPQAFHAPDAVVSPQPVIPPAGYASPAAAPAQRQSQAPPVAPLVTPPTPSSVAAEDTDTAFDEEWADKAREIVSRNHADPFLQSKEISQLKAQYIKARYNKDIKVSEE